MSEQRFDYQKEKAKKERAIRRGNPGAEFLHELAAEIIGERLAVVERKFSNPVLLFDGAFAEKVETVINRFSPPIKSAFKKLEKPDDYILAVEPGSIDLAVSIFDLHRVNDLPIVFFQILQALKPDGLFLAVMPSEGTLKELKTVLLNAEISATGGAGMRVDGFPDLRQFGDLLQKTGFKLPVCDSEERVIRYSKFESLIGDLRDLGAGNVATDEIRPLTKESLKTAMKLYAASHSDEDGKLRATVNLACLSAWKEDVSQQKPLKPGSAKHQLRDFI